MIIVGEKINSTLKAIRPAMEARDDKAIIDLAKKQQEAGAAFIDLNAGMFYGEEVEILTWLVNTIQNETDAVFALDSPNPAALREALKANKNGKPLINSITDEKERYDAVAPLLTEFEASIVALCMDDTGMPETIDDRFKIADRLINKLSKLGLKHDDIYIDPMIRPIGTGPHYGVVAIETIRRIKQEFPEVHIMCGLSNISFGIPARKIMNQAFLVGAVGAGMDGAILDPLDKKLMSFLYASEALFGIDEYCMEYLTQFREGNLEV